MLELNFSKYSSIAPVTWRGRCDVLAESRYAIPVSKMGKSLRTAATSNVNVDIAALHRDGKRPRIDHRGQARHLAGLEVEPRTVLGALHLAVLDHLAAAQQKVLMRAHVVDGVKTFLATAEADLLAVRDDSFD